LPKEAETGERWHPQNMSISEADFNRLLDSASSYDDRLSLAVALLSHPAEDVSSLAGWYVWGQGDGNLKHCDRIACALLASSHKTWVFRELLIDLLTNCGTQSNFSISCCLWFWCVCPPRLALRASEVVARGTPEQVRLGLEATFLFFGIFDNVSPQHDRIEFLKQLAVQGSVVAKLSGFGPGDLDRVFFPMALVLAAKRCSFAEVIAFLSAACGHSWLERLTCAVLVHMRDVDDSAIAEMAKISPRSAACAVEYAIRTQKQDLREQIESTISANDWWPSVLHD
jgi:hypothetical protein